MPHQSVVVIQPRILAQFSLKVNLFEPASGQVGPVLHLESGRELGVNKVGPPPSGDMGPSSIGAAGPSPTADSEAAGRFGSVSLDQNLSPPPLPLDYGAAVLLSLSSAASGCATASGTGTCRPPSRGTVAAASHSVGGIRRGEESRHAGRAARNADTT
jgi:hypothetical protein